MFTSDSSIICVRGATTLNYCQSIGSPIFNCEVTILVTSNTGQLCAVRGKQTQQWEQTSVHPLSQQDWLVRGGIPILGSERYLIVIASARVYLYDVDLPDGQLVRLKMSVPITQQLITKNPQDIKMPTSLTWSEFESLFTFFEPTEVAVCVWKLDSDEGSVQSIAAVSTELPIWSVAMSENFIVDSDDEKKIYIWDRQTTRLCHGGLSDLDDEESIDGDDPNLPLTMVIVNGDLMVSSSIQGYVICVWNLRTAQLLSRHTDPLDQHVADPMPEGFDVRAMVYLHALNTMVCCTGNLSACAFPTDDVMTVKVLSIRRRERNIRRVLLDIPQGQIMRGDSDYDSEDW